MNVVSLRFLFKLVSCWLLVAGLCFGKDQAAAPTPEFRFSEPLPEVATWAKANGWAIGSIEQATQRKEMALGDEMVVLAELEKKSKRQQWLIRLRLVPLTKEEQAENKNEAWTLHVISGRSHALTFNRCVLATEVAGPFVAGKKSSEPEIKAGRAVVFREMLADGFYELGPWLTKLHGIKQRATEEERIIFNRNWWRSNQPHPPETVNIGRNLETVYGVTAREEHVYFMHWNSLLNFFGVIIETPGMRGVLFEASDISWTSLMWNMAMGRKPRPQFKGREGPRLGGESWGLGGTTEVRSLPHTVSLYGKTVMRFNLAVVEPRPPLINTAGVIGFAAMRPDRDDVHVMMRVVGAKPVAEQ